MKNIVLIGIMGCGKSTIGRLLAEKNSMQFIDTDEYIEKKYAPIPELFKVSEEYFRNIEEATIKEVSFLHDAVISCGGGIIKREVNISNLKRNGIIVFIDRPLDSILSDVDISNRPLLKDGKEKLIELFKQRYPLYKKYSNICIENIGTADEAVDIITNHLKDY